MAIDRMKIMLSIMQELNDKKNIPRAKDYDITQNDFADIVEMCQDEGYIKDAVIQRGGDTAIVHLNFARLTVKGCQYLKDQSLIMKTYRGLKELREWL